MLTKRDEGLACLGYIDIFVSGFRGSHIGLM
jgi:hypothetical protein